MKNNKLMILGASILQLPAIVKARNMGLQTIVVDMDPHAVGFKHADFCVQSSTIDIPAVLAAAKSFAIDGIMTLASDRPMRTVAAVAKELGIVGIDEETAVRATNKGEMRECLQREHVPVPEFFRVQTRDELHSAIGSLNRKCIVKPADNSGSRGVVLLEDLASLAAIDRAYEYSRKYSGSGEIVVEAFMEGPEVSVETLSLDGAVHVIQITDKLTTGAPNFVEMGHSQPTQHPASTAEAIADVAKRAVSAIGIRNGPSHTEVKLTSEGPKIVEIGARLGGDCITTHLVPLSTGLDMVQCCIEIAMGLSPKIEKKTSKGAAIRYFQTGTGRLISVEHVMNALNVAGVREINITRHTGEQIGQVTNSSERVGFVISQGSTAEQAIDICEQAMGIVKINIDSQNDKLMENQI